MNDPADKGHDGTIQWRWEDLGWRSRVEDKPQWIVREALRRAVDIRDTTVTDSGSLRARPVGRTAHTAETERVSVGARPADQPPPPAQNAGSVTQLRLLVPSAARSAHSRTSERARLGTTKDARKIGKNLFPVHR